MALQRYDSRTLLAAQSEVEPVSTFWQRLCFPTDVVFTTEEIDFEKVSDVRKLAPYVAPLAQGRPIYSEATQIRQIRPAYVKPKDAVTAAKMIRSRPGALLSLSPMSPQQNRDATIGAILTEHSRAIDRRVEQMCAQVAQFGTITIVDQDYPERIIAYGRDAGHTVTLGGGARWGDVGVSIMDNIETWRNTMRQAAFGGAGRTLVVGSAVWAVMRKDPELKDLMDTQIRGSTSANFNRGFVEGMDVEYMGQLSDSLSVWVYNDYYVSETGVVVPMMDPTAICLIGPNTNGVVAYGAILDHDANLQALKKFPKQWRQEDPSVEYVMTQSAPLPVMTNPNATFYAKVLA